MYVHRPAVASVGGKFAMKAHKIFGSSKLILIGLLLLGGLTVSAVTNADSIFPTLGGYVTGTFFSSPAKVTQLTPNAEPKVWTDKNDYAPYETAQIGGSGFVPNQPVTLLVVHITPPGDDSNLKMESMMNSADAADHAGHTP